MAGVQVSLSVVQNTFDVNLIDTEAREIATLFVNMFISVSYPFNFVIYCCMSQQFRMQFAATFCGRCLTAAEARQSVSGSTTTEHAASSRRRSTGRRQATCVYELACDQVCHVTR